MKYLKKFENYRWGNIAAGIIPFNKTSNKFLVGLRSEYVLEPNTYGTFGGKLDIDEGIDETIEVAAKRELAEETNYNGEIDLIKGYVYRETNFEYHNFIGIVPIKFEPILNWENSEAIWLSYEELLELPNKHFGLIKFLKESSHIFISIVKN